MSTRRGFKKVAFECCCDSWIVHATQKGSQTVVLSSVTILEELL